MAFVQKGVCTNDFQKVLQNLMELDDEWTIRNSHNMPTLLGTICLSWGGQTV